MQNEITKNQATSDVILIQAIESLIHQIRGKKIMLDADLAKLYQVTTKRLNEQVKRNMDRFPEDFLFQLTQEEYASLRSQFLATPKDKRGGRRYLPYAFTEHGVLMAANILNSKQAIGSSIFVVRAFIKLREFAITYKDLAKSLLISKKRYLVTIKQ